MERVRRSKERRGRQPPRVMAIMHRTKRHTTQWSRESASIRRGRMSAREDECEHHPRLGGQSDARAAVKAEANLVFSLVSSGGGRSCVCMCVCVRACTRVRVCASICV